MISKYDFIVHVLPKMNTSIESIRSTVPHPTVVMGVSMSFPRPRACNQGPVSEGALASREVWNATKVMQWAMLKPSLFGLGRLITMLFYK